MRAMRQQFTTALEGLTRQNTELQNELNQSKQQAANEVLHCVGRRRRESVWTGVAGEAKRLLRGARRVSRLEHSVQGYAGAAIPRLQKLMDDAAKATAPTPNATILDDDDRAASAQL